MQRAVLYDELCRYVRESKEYQTHIHTRAQADTTMSSLSSEEHIRVNSRTGMIVSTHHCHGQREPCAVRERKKERERERERLTDRLTN